MVFYFEKRKTKKKEKKNLSFSWYDFIFHSSIRYLSVCYPVQQQCNLLPDKCQKGKGFQASKGNRYLSPGAFRYAFQKSDMLDFVEGYPEKKGQVFANSIGDVKKGEYPLLLQWDERWGYGDYGTSCVAVSGCAPTVISMAVAGLTGEDSITPYTVASYAQENGYYVPGSGTSWSLISEGIQHFGLFSQELPLSRDSVFQALESGMPIICSMRPGDFTTTGHFILLVGTEDGKIQVRDPNSTKRSEQLWDYETLEYQINNLWAVSQ